MSWHRYSQKNIKGEVKLYLQEMLVKTTHDKLENIKAKKILFLVKLCKLIKRGSILVNIDEAVFSPSTKINYFWNRRGMTSNRSTTLFSESVSIVSSILSNGISITGVRIGTIKSNTFIEYIGYLIYVWKRLGLNTNQICLFIDNSPVHWTKKCKRIFEGEWTDMHISTTVLARHGTFWIVFLPTEENDMRQKEQLYSKLEEEFRKANSWGGSQIYR